MTSLTRTPTNTDLLQSTKFRVTFDRLPGATYYCQSANLPGVSLTEIVRSTPFIDLFVPGEKMIYDTFNITFLVDEDLRAWTELHDWIRGITFPTDFKEYVDLARQAKAPYIPLIMTPLVYDPNNFTPRRGVMTRYAKKIVRPEFFGKIFIDGLATI